MEFQELSKKALEIRRKYAVLEIEKIGREWTSQEIMMGFVGDVGDLNKLVMAKGGLKGIDNLDEKLSHELADCLWCVLVLAQSFNINLEEEFLKTMGKLEDRIQDSKSSE